MRQQKKKRPHRPLTEQQKQAALILFDTGRVGETAARVGVHRATIWRWRNTVQFQREYERVWAKWNRDYRRERLKELHSSPEYKKQQAARRRLGALEKRISEAGNSGNMKAYRQACAAYDKCFNEAFGSVIKAFDRYFLSQEYSDQKKPRKAKKYIVEIID